VKQQDIMGFGAAQKPVDSSRATPADLADSEVNSRKSSFMRIVLAPPKQVASWFCSLSISKPFIFARYKYLTPFSSAVWQMLLTKTERHGRNPSGDSSGCSSGGHEDSISSSLTSNRQISTDSGTEADQVMRHSTCQPQINAISF
jgi:hypothetical protein